MALTHDISKKKKKMNSYAALHNFLVEQLLIFVSVPQDFQNDPRP